LFDTRPDRQEIRIGTGIAVLLAITLAADYPLRNLPIDPIDSFVPTTHAASLVCDAITAAVFYTQAARFRSRALTVLASGYVLAGLLLIPWALTFPGAFAATGLLGAKLNTTAWIAVTCRAAVPIAVILYVLLKRADSSKPVAERPPAKILPSLIVAAALAVSVTLLATVGHDLLPTFYVNRADTLASTQVTTQVALAAISIVAMVLLNRQEKSVLDLWLLVTMFAWLAQCLLNLTLTSRFTLGAYFYFGLLFVSNLIIMLAVVTEANRLYARLAVSTAARDRERDARLMSMEAVAAAIAHEVGQPLTAAKFSTSAALAALTKPKPDRHRAIDSLRDSLDSNQRAFDIMKSVRTSFASEGGTPSEFCLNDLVSETASLLGQELAAHKVSLQMSLDKALPPVTANRVQIQRVLFNLMTNAIEALADQPVRKRHVDIRTARVDGGQVCLDVSDTGAGIPPDKADEIFEPFYTTKPSGTGLGLALSNIIVEEHGGRLWATPNEGAGTTFHLQMHCGERA